MSKIPSCMAIHSVAEALDSEKTCSESSESVVLGGLGLVVHFHLYALDVHLPHGNACTNWCFEAILRFS